jgi:hypothetical protein
MRCAQTSAPSREDCDLSAANAANASGSLKEDTFEGSRQPRFRAVYQSQTPMRVMS